MSDAILVVDDDESLLEVVKEILELEGYDVQTARNGRDALDSLLRDRPSMVLLDMRMPVMDGWAFARELADRSIRVPILVMTAAQDASKWAQEIGADDYVAKPFDVPEMLGAVRRLKQGSGTAPRTGDSR